MSDVEPARVGLNATLEFENQEHRGHLVGSEPAALDQKVYTGRLEAERI
jgi:hypothetical protein